MTHQDTSRAHRDNSQGGQRARLPGRDLLKKYEGPIFVLIFLMVCLMALGWLMLPEAWRALSAWCASVALCVFGIIVSWPKRVQ